MELHRESGTVIGLSPQDGHLKNRTPRAQFTIRGLMLAVAAVAVLLVASAWWILVPVLLLIPSAVGVISRWLVSGMHRRAAAIAFWVTSLFFNAFYALSCIEPHYMLTPGLWFFGFIVVLPVIVGIGAAWVTLSTPERATLRKRSAWRARVYVATLAGLPLLTVWTFWPLRLAFLVSRPEMNRVADEVAAGRTIAWPRHVGPFVLVDSMIAAGNGNVGLITDPNPSGSAGFVRVRSRRQGGGPFSASGMGVDLDEHWEYRQED
jgi:hypothetical protein